MLVNTIHPPEDDPYFKPMEIKRAKSSKPSSSGPENFAQFCGPKSSTRRNDGKADITIKFDGKSFKAHKHVMREASELFEKEPAFQHYKKSKTYNLNSVNVLPEGCKPEIVKKVFDFAYTGRLPTYPANDFLDFFNVAVALHFHEALCIYDVQFNQLFKGAFRTVSTKVAANLISQAQKIRKPIQLSRCAEHLELIFDDTCKYLLKEPVDKLISDKDFLQDMSADGMEAFLDRDDLAKPEEENKVLDLVLAWVKYDQINRKMHAEKVMKKVHLGLLPRNRLTTLCSEMCWSPECKELIEKVLKLMDSKEEVGVPLEYSHYQWFGTRSEMFCDTMIGINPGGQAMVYFNTYGPQNRQGWQDWCGFQSIPEFEFPTWSTSVVSVNDKLYLAGGGQYRRSSSYSASGAYRCGRMMWNHGQVFEGNVGVKPHQVEEGEGHVTVDMVNPWSRYPRMKDARRSFPMVHLDDYLYAIGGEDDGYKAMKEAERFSFKDKKWEKIADLPVPCYYACATVYKGKILVYGSQPIRDPDTPAQHNLQMYDPATNQWENLLTEQHVISKYKKDNTPVESDKKESDKKEGKKNKDGEQRMEEDDNTGDDDDDKEDDDEDDDDENDDEDDYDSDKDLYENENEIGILLPKNALVVDGDDCFRVVYTPDVPSRGAAKGKLQPVVHKLVLDFTGSKPSVEIGEPQDQNLMPNSKEGAFQIHNQVYINMRGCVRNTGIQIAAGQTKKVDLGVWKKLFGKEEWFEDFEVQFANLKFNKRAVFCDRCVKGLACTNDGGRESELESVSGGGGGDCVVS